ncbi:TPA: hypothetical protein ACGO2G_001252 [Streptococcus suis]
MIFIEYKLSYYYTIFKEKWSKGTTEFNQSILAPTIQDAITVMGK